MCVFMFGAGAGPSSTMLYISVCYDSGGMASACLSYCQRSVLSGGGVSRCWCNMRSQCFSFNRQVRASVTQPPAATGAPATTTATPSAAHVHPGGEGTPATQVRRQDDVCHSFEELSRPLLEFLNLCANFFRFCNHLVHLCDLWLILSLLPQQRTAHAPPVLVPTVEPAWEEETPSPASARRAGKAPSVARVSASASLLHQKSQCFQLQYTSYA